MKLGGEEIWLARSDLYDEEFIPKLERKYGVSVQAATFPFNTSVTFDGC